MSNSEIRTEAENLRNTPGKREREDTNLLAMSLERSRRSVDNRSLGSLFGVSRTWIHTPWTKQGAIEIAGIAANM